MQRTLLHLIDTGGPGGAETIFLELVTRLDAARWRSIAVVPTRDWLHDALTARGVEPVVLPSRRAFDVEYLTALHRLQSRTGAALVQTHLFTTAVYGTAAARLAGLPVVSTFHGVVDFPRAGPSRAVKSRVLKRARNRAVFVSESLRRAAQPVLRLPAELTRVIANGIDTEVFRPGRDARVRAELGVGPGDLLVGAIGNVRASKDYPNLLRAAALLRQRSALSKLVIVGDTRSGELYPELLRLRAELGLEDVVSFTGLREDIPRVLGACDVYVLSSSQEGFSLTTVQAMACGIPVVATRAGGPEEIVTDGVDGLLVAAGDAEGLAAAVATVLRDAPLRGRLAQAARRTAETRYGVAAMVRAYERLYEELLEIPARVVSPAHALNAPALDARPA